MTTHPSPVATLDLDGRSRRGRAPRPVDPLRIASPRTAHGRGSTPARSVRGRPSASDQRGAVLVLVLALVLLGSLVVAGLVMYVFTNISSTRAYRGRTDAVQEANDAVNLAIAEMRTDRTRGVDGSTHDVTYGGIDVSCVGETGSGAAGGIGIADRRVTCEAAKAGELKLRVRIRFVDQGGTDPGSEVEITDRDILG